VGRGGGRFDKQYKADKKSSRSLGRALTVFGDAPCVRLTDEEPLHEW
jgi:hypothetical protein